MRTVNRKLVVRGRKAEGKGDKEDGKNTRTKNINALRGIDRLIQ